MQAMADDTASCQISSSQKAGGDEVDEKSERIAVLSTCSVYAGGPLPPLVLNVSVLNVMLNRHKCGAQADSSTQRMHQSLSTNLPQIAGQGFSFFPFRQIAAIGAPATIDI